MAVISLDFSSTMTSPSTTRLAEAQVDHVQRIFALWPNPERARQGLAIHGDDLTGGDLVNGLDPTEEALDELFAIEQGEDPADGVMRRDAIGQLQELLQPVPFGVPELLHGDEVIGAGDHGTDGEEQDVAVVGRDCRSMRGSSKVSK